MIIELVLTPFLDSEEGRRIQWCADQLASDLQIGSFTTTETMDGPADACAIARITEYRIGRARPGCLETFRLYPGTLVVTNTLPRRQDLIVLQSKDARRIDLSEKRCIFIPFGTGESALHAAPPAIEIARKTGMPLVFYHTTWRNESLSSKDPRDHMEQAAKAVQQRLKTWIAQAELPEPTVIVEMADDVMEGILFSAIVHKAALIATACNPQMTHGSYAVRLQTESPIPILSVGPKVKVSS